MALPLQQARGIFTQTLIASYRQRTPVASFLKSFFQVKTSKELLVSIEVERDNEKIAAQVLRGTTGNRNTFSKFTEKIFMPPMYHETFDHTSLDYYDRVFGRGAMANGEVIGTLAGEVTDRFLALQNKIERAKELQCQQVLETGIVVTKYGDNIDYKRKAASMFDNSGSPWSTTTTDVESQLIVAAEFIRQKGKNGTPEFNLIMPGAIWLLLKKTDYFKNNANYNQVKLIDINMPQASAFGAAYHGRITAGAYIFNCWTYDEGYENDGGTFVKYLHAKKVIILPVSGSRLYMAHGGIPKIIRDKGNAEFPQMIQNVATEYYIHNYIDPMATVHNFEIKTAPLAVPVTVDQIYTTQVIA